MPAGFFASLSETPLTVSPVEIEGELDRHPAVLESAVVGVPHPVDDTHPRAFVVLRPGASATEQALCDHVKDKLAEHKWLRGGVVFLDALLKTANGKINRTALFKRYVETADSS